ncbi:MAG: class II aldolase/adducin family protein [Candidatus Omnitrophota bacterium]
MDEKILKEEIIKIGKRLYDLRLVVARAGNLSAKVDADNILITATGISLGVLTDADVIKIDLSKDDDARNKKVTSEFPLHRLIHKNFSSKVVIHCHPTLINAYFAVCNDLKALTFETKLYLGNVPVVEQDTPAITKPELVIDALKLNNLVVVKNHGVVSVADNFSDALHLIEALEEAVKVAAIARLFKKDVLDDLDVSLKADLAKDEVAYPMFSREHIQAIVDLVNKDEFIAAKGKELGLTLQLAIKLADTQTAFKFNFENGHIVRLDNDADAPFIISAPAAVWEQVFLGKLDSFVAVTQGKMKLQGQLAQLSKWYVPFTRLFQIFKQVKFI